MDAPVPCLGDSLVTTLVATSVAIQQTGPIFLWMKPRTQDGGQRVKKVRSGVKCVAAFTQLHVSCFLEEICL